MRDQLRRLEELQQHDARIQELENALKAIPAKLASTQADLARVEGMLTTERSALGSRPWHAALPAGECAQSATRSRTWSNCSARRSRGRTEVQS